MQLSLVLNFLEIPGEDYFLNLKNKTLVIQYLRSKPQRLSPSLICF